MVFQRYNLEEDYILEGLKDIGRKDIDQAGTGWVGTDLVGTGWGGTDLVGTGWVDTGLVDTDCTASADFAYADVRCCCNDREGSSFIIN